MEEDGETTDELKITYDLYESFWKLQTLLASDLRALDQPSPSWQDFMRNARAVVDVFKSHHASSASSSGSSSGTTETYQSTKYLTSCQVQYLSPHQFRCPPFSQSALFITVAFHFATTRSSSQAADGCAAPNLRSLPQVSKTRTIQSDGRCYNPILLQSEVITFDHFS